MCKYCVKGIPFFQNPFDKFPGLGLIKISNASHTNFHVRIFSDNFIKSLAAVVGRRCSGDSLNFQDISPAF